MYGNDYFAWCNELVGWLIILYLLTYKQVNLALFVIYIYINCDTELIVLQFVKIIRKYGVNIEKQEATWKVNIRTYNPIMVIIFKTLRLKDCQ